MHYIHITHNPFIVETQFLINGEPPAEGCKLTSYKELRLQLWIERLFDELRVLFNGDSNFHLVFRGVESDYADMLEAANTANANGMLVEVEWQETEPTESRLELMHALMDEAHAHREFADYISRDADMKNALDEALDANFDVVVVATMSSGKSTLINAMLGRDLLPAANEATTAIITSIADMKGSKAFRGARRDAQGDEVEVHNDLTLDVVSQWNRLPDTKQIVIEGDIQAVQQRDDVRLVLTDTPGPNNSQDEGHERATLGFVQDSKRNPLILYVLNASQLATNDDRNLLKLIAETMRKGGKQSKDRFLFVINKMDVFDPDREKGLPEVLADVRHYLAKNGIEDALLFPVSANFARLIRKPSDMHSRKERGDYNAMADLFGEEPSMNLLQYMPITSRVRSALDAKAYSPLMLSSGVPAVEAMIDEYIDKYNLPHRVKRVYDVLSKAIDKGLNATQLTVQLEQGEAELARIGDELQDLQARRKKGFDAASYKDEVAREGKMLPEATEQALTELEGQSAYHINAIASNFTGSTTLEKAESKMEEAESTLRFVFNMLLNEYEDAFVASQQAIKDDLTQAYQRYVTDLFGECQNLDLPVLEGLRKTIADLSLNLGVEKKEVKKRKVVVSSYEVSSSSWYKPWTWGDTETVYVYGEETYVDLGELWRERRTRIGTEFANLVKSARKRIEEDKDKLVDQFLAFMDEEFDEKFDILLNSIDEKLRDKTVREAALQEARTLQDWIIAYKTKLDNALAV